MRSLVTQPDYKDYLEHILDLGLLAPDGIILADNVIYKVSTSLLNRAWARS